jgi:Arc/MetJ family transcription regulator
MGAKIFVSSTVYDLIDIRAEVEAELRDMGLIPILSDSLTSDFIALPDNNSIESCLSNVRTCDVFLIILSQRYGPSLIKAGYPDKSATHMEYEEAKKANKPIYMYIRDRLEADFFIWKNRKDSTQKLSWIKPNSEKIFDLLRAHRKLTVCETSSNWFWIFRDSIELKRRIRKDLGIHSGKSRIRSLIKDNRIALAITSNARLFNEYQDIGIIPTSEKTITDFWYRSTFEYTITNHGGGVAIKPVCILRFNNHEIYRKKYPSLSIYKKITDRSTIEIDEDMFREAQQLLRFSIRYTTPEGLVVSDISKCKVKFNFDDSLNLNFLYEGKEVIALDTFSIASKK